ncbi:MAG: NUDIX hydrolase [Acidimicrobiia bacterium]|nr:NUDIX hydrolase [Acidimicrobiia bacterium]
MIPDRPTRLDRRTVYSSPYVSLHLDRVALPGGRIIDDYHVIGFETGAVGAVIRNEGGDILCIESYRYPTDTVGWEIPAGQIDHGETVLEAARRESLEETGYAIEEPRITYSYRPMAGRTTAESYIVEAKVGDQIGDFDRNEVRQVRWMDLSTIRTLIETRQVSDGLSVTAMLLLLARTP